MIQKTIPQNKNVKLLFKGDSCYPQSPIKKVKENDLQNQIPISKNDQIIKIFKTLNVNDKDINFIQCENKKTYLSLMAKQSTQGSQNELKTKLDGLDEDLADLILKTVKVKPADRESIE